MQVREITDKNIWEGFLADYLNKTFLDSWNWGEFQKRIGNKLWRFGIYDVEKLAATALVIKIKAKRGTFLFVPHAPAPALTKEDKSNHKLSILKILARELKKIAKEEGASFIRIAPLFERNSENERLFKDLGFRGAPTHMHPEVTWELDITPSEEKLLAGMRKTTRYLIRQAEKNKDIEIIQSKEVEDAETFYKLHEETVSRHHFVPFSRKYINAEFETFAPDDQIAIFLGKYRGQIVSSAIIIFWQDAAFYHHGASSQHFSKTPVSYLLQWQIIKEARCRGCKIYNFWGIAPENCSGHPWAGLSLFKIGFGGYKKEYVKTQDFPLSWRYWLIAVFEVLRKTKRGL